MKDGKIIYVNGKVIAYDKKNNEDTFNIQEYEYQDNIIQIIKIENIIEELENLKEELSKNLNENYDTIYRFKNIIKIFPILVSPIYLTFSLSSDELKNTVIKLLFSILCIGSFETSAIKYYGNTIKENKGFVLELEELEKLLINYKELLKKHYNDKTKYNQEEAEARRYDDIHNIHLKRLKEIKEFLLLYYTIGEKEKQLLKYYSKGVLEKKLNEEYEPAEIEIIKTYFKFRN